jgi:hypothetical protein
MRVDKHGGTERASHSKASMTIRPGAVFRLERRLEVSDRALDIENKDCPLA